MLNVNCWSTTPREGISGAECTQSAWQLTYWWSPNSLEVSLKPFPGWWAPTTQKLFQGLQEYPLFESWHTSTTLCCQDLDFSSLNKTGATQTQTWSWCYWLKLLTLISSLNELIITDVNILLPQTKTVILSGLFNRSPFIVLGLVWKQSHIFGHIYAEVEKFLKDLQTFKWLWKCSPSLPVDVIADIWMFAQNSPCYFTHLVCI